jgi:hypothetical protein
LEKVELALEMGSLLLPEVAAGFEVAHTDLEGTNLQTALSGLGFPAITGKTKGPRQGTFGRAILRHRFR